MNYVHSHRNNNIGGRNKLLTSTAIYYITSLLNENHYTSLKTLITEFINLYYTNPEDAPSYSTFYRAICNENFSRKVMERRNINIDHEERFNFLENIKFLHPSMIIDIDETASSPEQFYEKYGWSKVGEKCIRTQITIGTRHFTVVAAYSDRGFLCWDIIEGSYNSDTFIRFLRDTVYPMIIPGQCIIVDNASVHHTAEAEAALEQYSYGMFLFSPRYSPDLKPIEKGFALVKRWLREHEIEALENPVNYINFAFELYSTTGERGHIAKNHWKDYLNNHNRYWVLQN